MSRSLANSGHAWTWGRAGQAHRERPVQACLSPPTAGQGTLWEGTSRALGVSGHRLGVQERLPGCFGASSPRGAVWAVGVTHPLEARARQAGAPPSLPNPETPWATAAAQSRWRSWRSSSELPGRGVGQTPWGTDGSNNLGKPKVLGGRKTDSGQQCGCRALAQAASVSPSVQWGQSPHTPEMLGCVALTGCPRCLSDTWDFIISKIKQ